jgi:hypothetical protein
MNDEDEDEDAQEDDEDDDEGKFLLCATNSSGCGSIEGYFQCLLPPTDPHHRREALLQVFIPILCKFVVVRWI